jgi:para-aminobenzoate synthetase/4-amino-4-deoxychorismate lyase
MVHAVLGSFKENSNPLLVLHSPNRIYSATQVAEVVSLINSAEEAAASGSWVVLMVTYEAAPAFDLALKTHKPGFMPLAWAAIFDNPSEGHSHHVKPSHDSRYHLTGWEPQIQRDQYDKAIITIRELIARGDTYQVNYTFPLVSSFKGDSEHWYDDLCRAQTAEYCAYLDLGRYKILSLSPELFFERKGDAVKTKPMKGTINRGRWTAEDEEQAHRLAESQKDRAENVMIVDLLRNDLGKVSIPGSVRVSNLFEVERFETLWQMTSTVESTLRPGVGLSELVTALFPVVPSLAHQRFARWRLFVS